MGHLTSLGLKVGSDGCGGAGLPLQGFMFNASVIQVYGQLSTEKLSSFSIIKTWIFLLKSTQLFLQCVNIVEHFETQHRK